MYRSPGVFLVAAEGPHVKQLIDALQTNRVRGNLPARVHQTSNFDDGARDEHIEHLVLAMSSEMVEQAAQLHCGIIVSDHETARATGTERPSSGDVIVLYGHSDPMFPAKLTKTAERRLARAQKIAGRSQTLRAIILSGRGPAEGVPPEADQYAVSWRGARMPVIREVASRSTDENAYEATLLIRALGGVERVLVVTSWWHMPRAVADLRRHLADPSIIIVACPAWRPLPGWQYLRSEIHLAFLRQKAKGSS